MGVNLQDLVAFILRENSHADDVAVKIEEEGLLDGYGHVYSLM